MRNLRKANGRLLTGGALLPIAMLGASPAMAQDEQASDQAAASSTENVIIVTARFREESVQDIGGSISALSGDQLSEQGIDSTRDLANLTPSLNIQDRGPGRNEISMRGVGRSVFQQDLTASAPNIGVYIDDVPVNVLQGAQIDIHSFDLGRVEVLRGPQGTLFGEGAEGGAIRYFTRDPDLNDIVVSGEVSYKSVHKGGDDFGGGLAVSVPLLEDKVALRLVANRTVEPGYIYNAVDQTKDINDYRGHDFRAVLLAEPNDQLRIRLLGGYSESKQGAFATINGDPKDQTIYSISTDGNYVDDEYYIASGNISYDFGPIKVESITSYFERNRDRDVMDAFFSNQAQAFRQFLAVLNPYVDFGGPDLSGLFVSTGPVEPVSSYDQSHFDQFSQEVRFISDFDGPLNFVAGAFYRKFNQRVVSTTRSQQNVDLLPIYLANIGLDQLLNPDSIYAGFTPTIPANPSTNGAELAEQLGLVDFLGAPGGAINVNKGEQISVFAEVAFQATEQLKLTLGLRSHNEKLDAVSIASAYDLLGGLAGAFVPDDFPPVGIPELGNVDVNVILPKVSLEYKPNDSLLIYAIYSEGVRNGNINAGSTAAVIGQSLGAELAQEITAFGEERVRAFEVGSKFETPDGRGRLNIAASINKIKDLQSFVTFPGPPAFGLIQNVGTGKTWSIEAEGFYEVNDNVRLFAGGSYTDAEIDKIYPTDKFVIGTFAGQPIPFIPDWNFNAGIDSNFDLGNSGLEGIARLTFSYTGDYPTFADGAPGTRLNPILGNYGLFDAVVGVRKEGWAFEVRASNLLNERKINQASPTTAVIEGALGGFDFAPADAPLDFLDDFQITRPRTITATLKFDF